MAEAGNSPDGKQINDIEPKITEKTQSETKMSRKRRDKSLEREPAYSQAHIDKISLPLRLYSKLE